MDRDQRSALWLLTALIPRSLEMLHGGSLFYNAGFFGSPEINLTALIFVGDRSFLCVSRCRSFAAISQFTRRRRIFVR